MERHSTGASGQVGGHAAENGVAARQGALFALEASRRAIHGRLDELESLARNRLQATTTESDARAEQLAARLEQERAQLARLRKEQDAALSQLEHDRQLLADSWERLEQDRLKCASPPHEPDHERRAVTETRAIESTLTSNLDDPVVQGVLRQFQRLQRDVRKRSQAKR
jgi:hypothetical protein